jgi:5-methylcytosine-specific restriction endonuclease McrA
MSDQSTPALNTCTKCRETKPATPEFFHRRSGTESGRLRSHCKDCIKIYLQANHEKIAQKRKKHYQANHEIIEEKKKKYYQDNPEKLKQRKEKISQYAKGYRQANLEKLKQKEKEYYQANREKVSQRRKDDRQANPEKFRKRDREYRQANPEVSKIWAQENLERVRELTRESARKRRALKLQNGHSPYSEAAILSLHGTNCHLCNQPIDFDAPRQIGKPGWELGLHIDHVIPISKGGSDTLKNVKPAHGLCNITKNNKV